MESATIPILNGLQNGGQIPGMVIPASRPMDKESVSISHITYSNGSELYRLLDVNGESPNIIEVVPDIRPPSNSTSVSGKHHRLCLDICQIY